MNTNLISRTNLTKILTKFNLPRKKFIKKKLLVQKRNKGGKPLTIIRNFDLI